MALLTGSAPISLFTVPALADREWLSVNSKQTDATALDPVCQALGVKEIPSTNPGFEVEMPSFTHRTTTVPVGVNSFLYDRMIRQSGATRLDGQVLNLGQIREDKLISETLWNGFNKHIKITDISYSYVGSGVTVNTPEVDDIANPIQEIPLEIEITIAGSPLFDVDITITYEELEGVHIGTEHTYTFSVAGSRLPQKEFVFLTDANWTGGLTVKSKWLTSIYQASETSETRQMLRSKPIRDMSYEFASTGKDFTTATWGFLQSLALSQSYVPFFVDPAVVTETWSGGKIYCDTVKKRFYVGGTVVIVLRKFDNSYVDGSKNDLAIHYTAVVAGVDTDGLYLVTSPLAELPKGTTIYPGMLSEIAVEENVIESISAERSIVNINLEEVYGSTTLPIVNDPYSPTEFYDKPFFDFEWNWINPPKTGVSRPSDRDSSGRSNIVIPKTDKTQSTIEALVSVHSRVEWWEVGGFLDYIKGRYKSFWLKSPLDGLRKGVYTLYDGSDLTEFEVVFVGGFNNLSSVQAVWLQAADGTQQIAKVTNITETFPGSYVFEIDPVEIPDIASLKQAFLVRNSKDEVEERWITSQGLVEIPLSLIELPAGYE